MSRTRRSGVPRAKSQEVTSGDCENRDPRPERPRHPPASENGSDRRRARGNPPPKQPPLRGCQSAGAVDPVGQDHAKPKPKTQPARAGAAGKHRPGAGGGPNRSLGPPHGRRRQTRTRRVVARPCRRRPTFSCLGLVEAEQALTAGGADGSGAAGRREEEALAPRGGAEEDAGAGPPDPKREEEGAPPHLPPLHFTRPFLRPCRPS